MNKKHQWVPIIIGLVIGFIMMMSFVLGYRLLFDQSPTMGSFLITLSLVLYPMYILFVIGLSYFKKKTLTKAIKTAWHRSILVVPLGAVFAVIIVIPVVYIIFG